MSNIRYDIEGACAQSMADWLNSACNPAVIGPNATPPILVVTFFDPMSIDEDSRLVIEVPNATTDTLDIASWQATYRFTLKSRWRQSTLEDNESPGFTNGDWTNHLARTNEVRDKLLARNMVTLLNAQIAADGGGFSLWQVMPQRRFNTNVVDHYFVSTMDIEVKGVWQ